jgi:uncharacterized protein (TIGR03435 family)
MAVAALLASAALAQSTMEFEVVSIKPVSPGSEGAETRILPGGRYVGHNVDIPRLIRNSFLVEDPRISGLPGWARSDTYDIEARTAKGVEIAPGSISRLMLSILESRFQFRFHRETREIPVYALEVRKGGLKAKPHAGELTPSMSTNSNSGVVTFKASKASMKDLAAALTRQVGRPVIDRSGVTGDFDFNLEWSSDQAAEPGTSVFSALQTLGLRLVPAKGPADFIVIDHVERASEN